MWILSSEYTFYNVVVTVSSEPKYKIYGLTVFEACACYCNYTSLLFCVILLSCRHYGGQTPVIHLIFKKWRKNVIKDDAFNWIRLTLLKSLPHCPFVNHWKPCGRYWSLLPLYAMIVLFVCFSFVFVHFDRDQCLQSCHWNTFSLLP